VFYARALVWEISDRLILFAIRGTELHQRDKGPDGHELMDANWKGDNDS